MPDASVPAKGRDIASEMSRFKQRAMTQLKGHKRELICSYIDSLARTFNADTCSFADWPKLKAVFESFEGDALGPPSAVADAVDTEPEPPQAAAAAQDNMTRQHLQRVKAQMKKLAGADPDRTASAFYELAKEVDSLLRVYRSS